MRGAAGWANLKRAQGDCPPRGFTATGRATVTRDPLIDRSGSALTAGDEGNKVHATSRLKDTGAFRWLLEAYRPASPASASSAWAKSVKSGPQAWVPSSNVRS